jgi:hypothetical protein
VSGTWWKPALPLGPVALRWLSPLGLAVLMLGQPSWSQGRQQPDPPASRPTLYDADRTTCNPETIRSAFQQQLQPYADQSAAVLARLRQVQIDMTRRTLSRCVTRELLTPRQADQLARDLFEAPIRP